MKYPQAYDHTWRNGSSQLTPENSTYIGKRIVDHVGHAYGHRGDSLSSRIIKTPSRYWFVSVKYQQKGAPELKTAYPTEIRLIEVVPYKLDNWSQERYKKIKDGKDQQRGVGRVFDSVESLNRFLRYIDYPVTKTV